MKIIASSIMSVAFATFALSTAGVRAAEEEKMTKPITVEGTATCAKCDLGTAEKCESVLQVKKDGKTETYVLAGKAGGDWHQNICKGAKEVKATGTVTAADGKKTFNASDIEITDAKKKEGEPAKKG